MGREIGGQLRGENSGKDNYERSLEKVMWKPITIEAS